MPRDSVSIPNFAAAVEKFTAAGVPAKVLIPVAPPGAKILATSNLNPKDLGKAPGRYNPRSGEWSGYHGAVVVNGMRPQDHDEAADWPTGNVGLLGRMYPAIDSDAMSPEVRRMVEEVVCQEFGEQGFAERVRGKNDRRLYVFRAANPGKDPVRTRHVSLKVPGDDTLHKIDIIGLGGQFLISGTHPSGDAYEWAKGAALHDPAVHDSLTRVTDDDVTRFLEAIEDECKRRGWEFSGRTSTGSNSAKDPADMDPTFDNDTIFRGLDRIPNTEDTFPHRDDLVSFCGAIRAAAGRNSEDPDFIDRVREWATADGWADDSYFDKVWDSLRYVRATPDTLDRIFRKNGVFHQVAQNFGDDAAEASDKVKADKATSAKVRGNALARIAARYVFRDTNTDLGHKTPTMRDAWDISEEWQATDWFVNESTRRGADLAEINAEYGDKKRDFWDFFADLKARHPDSFFYDFVKDPFHDYGQIVVDVESDPERPRNRLNIRHLSPTIKAAAKADKNPARSAKDVQTILEFVERLFGRELARYELDTLAFMVQKKSRPGAMLFLVGEPGVGKSTYIQLNSVMFNGTRTDQNGSIDGTKLVSENSRRFALSNVEGCRIISIKEMPKGRNNSAQLQQITSVLKQLVDPGIEGDTFIIERKNENAIPIKNYARVVVSSNHADSIEIETHDRRIFMVESQINLENKPGEDYYKTINDIIVNPERLAAFYRYLETRDIGDFSRNVAPPVSSAKRERIVATIENAPERHMHAALQWLQYSGRVGFTMPELCKVMDECAELEFQRTGGGVDDRANYVKTLHGDMKERTALMNGLRGLPKLTVKTTRQRKDGAKNRLPPLYLFKEYGSKVEDLDLMSNLAYQEFLEDEEDRPLSKSHPWQSYQAKGA